MFKTVTKLSLLVSLIIIMVGCGTTQEELGDNPYKGKGWYETMEQIAINYRTDLAGEPSTGKEREVERFLQSVQDTGAISLTEPTTPDELNNIIDATEGIPLFDKLTIQLDGVTLSQTARRGQVLEQGTKDGDNTENLSVVFLHGLSMGDVLLTDPEDIEEGLLKLSGQTDRVLVYVVQDVAGFIPLYVVHKGHVYYNVFS